MEDRWRNLEVWKRADALALELYRVSGGFPREELYGLTSQLRRAGLSIPMNIVEGYCRKGDKELSRFLNISLGSLGEVKYLLHFARSLGHLNEVDYMALARGYDELGRMLWRFCKRVE